MVKNGLKRTLIYFLKEVTEIKFTEPWTNERKRHSVLKPPMGKEESWSLASQLFLCCFQNKV